MLSESLCEVFVWDPLNGQQHRVSFPPELRDVKRGSLCLCSATVMCVDDQAAHVDDDCFLSPSFKLVLLCTSRDLKTSFVCVYEFASGALGVIETPTDAQHIKNWSFQLLRTDDDSVLGLAVKSRPGIHIWERKLNSDGVAGWVLLRKINQLKGISSGAFRTAEMVGYDEELNVMVLSTYSDDFMVNLKTMHIRLISKTDKWANANYFPYRNFYRAASVNFECVLHWLATKLVKQWRENKVSNMKNKQGNDLKRLWDRAASKAPKISSTSTPASMDIFKNNQEEKEFAAAMVANIVGHKSSIYRGRVSKLCVFKGCASFAAQILDAGAAPGKGRHLLFRNQQQDTTNKCHPMFPLLLLLLLQYVLQSAPATTFSNITDVDTLLAFKVSVAASSISRVTVLNLTLEGLAGTITPSIGNLTFLKILDLSQNNFHGEIPSSIGRLLRLQHLNLASNSLDSDVNADLKNCTSLESIDLDRNLLTGEIPAWLGGLSNLKTIKMYRNRFTGIIPPSITNLSALQTIDFTANQLKGVIPQDLGKMTSLSSIQLSENHLSGIIPAAFFNFPL
ncbi:hypothetical protein D1007_41836 [Hordeum vulgare]|nr:hypothetical protein D1007_41836 [Hordeum vulgare]